MNGESCMAMCPALEGDGEGESRGMAGRCVDVDIEDGGVTA